MTHMAFIDGSDVNDTATVAWMGLRRLLQDSVVIIATRSSSLATWLVDVLGDLYWVNELPTMCPTMFGWNLKQQTKFIVLHHRVKALPSGYRTRCCISSYLLQLVV